MRFFAFVRHGLVGTLATAILGAGCGPTSGGEDLGSGGQSTDSGGQASGGGPSTGGTEAAGGSASGGTTSGGGTGGDASSGGAGSGGTSSGGGSGGEPPLCPGVPATCEPGAVGCSERGEAYVCSECGEQLLQGTDCARLLASDKEGGLVCVVRGERQLVCAGGPAGWSQELEFPVELPAFATKLSLPDDSTTSTADIAYCAISDDQGLFCTPGITPSGAAQCTDVAVSDNSTACSICEGTLECPDLSVPGVEQVVLVDYSPYWLDSQGEIHWSITSEPILPGHYVFLFLDDFQTPCGIQDDGDLICALEAGSTADVVEVAGPFVDGAGLAGGARCAIRPTGSATCFAIEDGDTVPIFAPPETDLIRVAATQNAFCALTRAGAVVCWNSEGPLPDLSDPLN